MTEGDEYSPSRKVDSPHADGHKYSSSIHLIHRSCIICIFICNEMSSDSKGHAYSSDTKGHKYSYDTKGHKYSYDTKGYAHSSDTKGLAYLTDSEAQTGKCDKQNLI